jgi:hypothetical protein
MKTKDPAFLMYSKDWLEGTAEYMPDEKGVYIDLLCHQHQKGSLPCDKVRLARMTGLPVEQFEKIWLIINVHFDQIDDRLVNRKMERVMNERADKSKMNTITGTFAGLLRLGNYTSKEYKHLKSCFVASDFIQYDKEMITERLTEWLTNCLKSIEDANASIDNTSLIYNSFYDEEIKLSNNDPDYISIVKTIFGENKLGTPLKVILKMPNQLSYKQFQNLMKLKATYGIVISSYLEKMENWGNPKKYTTVYQTMLSFIRRDHKDMVEK